MMLGGVICGYCAMGNVQTAIPPASVMTIDSTAAKIGRSMKKRENTAALRRSATLIRAGSVSDGLFLPSLTLRALISAAHLRLDFHVAPHLLQAADDDALVRLEALLNDPQVIVQRADADVAHVHLVVGRDDVDELLPLVGRERLFGDKERLVRD